MLNLTREERRVILFLLTFAAAGTGLNLFLKTHCGIRAFAAFSGNLDRVSLNRADKSALMSLPGIGEKLAGRIIDYRAGEGGFNQVNELKNIKGITERKYEKLKGSVYVE